MSIKVGYCKKQKRFCYNKNFIICDTNYFFFIIEYILYNYIKNDLNNWIERTTQNTGQKPEYRIIERQKKRLLLNSFIPLNDVITEFNKFLKQSSECSVNGKINVTKRLFDSELDILGKKYNSIQKSFLFKKFPRLNVKKRIASILERYLDKEEKVDDDDVKAIYLKGKDVFKETDPPSESDISLVLLGLKKSYNKNYKSILITEDTKLELLYENYLKPEDYFRVQRGKNWNLTNFKFQNMVLFLGNIFSCCERYDLDKIMIFYREFMANLMRKIKHGDTKYAKYRKGWDVASDCSQNLNSKPKVKGATT